MQTDEHPPELLVPPKRLGMLLAQARLSRGLSLAEASAELGGDWSSFDLLEVETGRRPVFDPELEVLTGLYHIPTTSLVPDRSFLIIDLNEGTLGVGAHQTSFDEGAQRQDVLTRYLTLVYAMRDLPPGTPVPLRDPDLAVLADSMSVPVDQVGSELQVLMDASGEVFTPRLERLRHRILIPAIGIVVAATAVGVLLLVGNDDDASTVTTRRRRERPCAGRHRDRRRRGPGTAARRNAGAGRGARLRSRRTDGIMVPACELVFCRSSPWSSLRSSREPARVIRTTAPMAMVGRTTRQRGFRPSTTRSTST